MIKIGILSTYNSPLLSLLLSKIINLKEVKFHILIDEKGLKDKDLEIWNDRTKGKLDEYIKYFNLTKSKNIIYKYFISHNSNACLNYIKKHKLSWVVNCGTPRKISEEFLQLFQNKVVNIHPGLLPKYRGSCCVEWAIYNGDNVGNTLHLMTKEYDEGPILLKESYNLKGINDYTDVRVLIYKKGIELLVNFFKLVVSNKMHNINYNYEKTEFIYKPIPNDKLKVVKEIVVNFGKNKLNNRNIKVND